MSVADRSVVLSDTGRLGPRADAEVIAALTGLGYSVVEAQAALQSLPGEKMELEEKVRLALGYFADRSVTSPRRTR